MTEPLGISFSDIQDDYPADLAGLEPGVIINNIDEKNTYCKSSAVFTQKSWFTISLILSLYD